MSTTDSLKVLTPELAKNLCAFNAAARELQRMGVKIAAFFPRENRLQITAEGGHKLLTENRISGCRRAPTAGSTHFFVLFQGVTLDWHETITYRNYQI